MCLYVYYACAYAHVCIYTLCACVCMMFMDMCIYICIYIYIYIHINAYTCKHACTPAANLVFRSKIHTCMIRTHTHTVYIHIYTHTHMHDCMITCCNHQVFFKRTPVCSNTHMHMYTCIMHTSGKQHDPCKYA